MRVERLLTLPDGRHEGDTVSEPEQGEVARRRWHALRIWLPVVPGAVLLLIGIVLNNACSIPHEQWDWGCLFGLIAAPYALVVGGIVAGIGLLVVLGDLRAQRKRTAPRP